MSTSTIADAYDQFQNCSDNVRIAVVLLVYGAIAAGLVYFLGFDGESMGGFTGLDGVPR